MIEVVYTSTPDSPDHSGVVRVYEKGKELTSIPMEYSFNGLRVEGNHLVLNDEKGDGFLVIDFKGDEPLVLFKDGLEDLP